MEERKGLITFKGTPLTLVGPSIGAGDKAPDFTATDNDLNPVSLSSFIGKTIIVSSVPSLDTPVCSLQTQRFNKEAGGLGSDVKVLTLSMDLPFAQKRWCAAEGATNLQTLSDYKDAAFGLSYGLLIKELRLLARSVMILDKRGVVRYTQLVKEVTTEPDYEDVMKKINEIK